MSNGHDAAPATALVATHCALCGRPLVDAESAERGVGPVCAAKYGADEPQIDPAWSLAGKHLWAGGIAVETIDEGVTTHDAHRLANAAVYRIAAAPAAPEARHLVEAIRALGYVRLAERLTERLAEEGAVKVEQRGHFYAVYSPKSDAFREALDEHAPGRWWDREARVWCVPVRAREGLWKSLRTAYAGHALVTETGTRMIA